jgi:hypothetical protein
MRCGMKMLSKKPVCSPIACNIWREGTPASVHAFSCLFFSSSTRSHPVCPVCSSTCTLTNSEAPPRAPRGRRRGQAAWALASVRMRPWHAMVCLLIPGDQFNDMSSGATSSRYSRDAKLYAQGGDPFVLNDDDPRPHWKVQKHSFGFLWWQANLRIRSLPRCRSSVTSGGVSHSS